MLKEFTIFLKVENLAIEEVHKRKYLIQPGKPLVIGRSKDSHIVLLDENVSRKHAMFKVDGDTLFIKDLNSGNGTFLDGEKVTSRPLREEQLIVIGGFEMKITKITGAPSKIVPDDIVIEEDTKELSTAQAPKSAADLPRTIRPDSGADKTPAGDPWEGKMNVEGFKTILVDAWKLFLSKKIDFFLDLPLRGSTKNSLLVITIATTIPALVNLLLSSSDSIAVIVNALVGIALAIGTIFVTAKLMYSLKNWMGILHGDFENFLRFYAYSSLITFPLNLISFAPGIGAFAGLASGLVGILFLIGFFLRFQPILGKYIIAFFLSVMIGIGATICQGIITSVFIAEELPTTNTQEKKNLIQQMKGERKALKDAFDQN